MARCLITGITGMVGSHLCDYILDNTDWLVGGLIRWRSPLYNLRERLSDKRLTLYNGDITDYFSVQAVVKLVRPQYVFHLAAQSFPKTSFESPIATYDTNIQGTQNVLEAIRQYAPDAIVHVCSSSEVFGRVPKDKLPIDESCTFHPASPYAISKCGTDLIGRYFAEAYGLNTQVTRMFTHTGPRRGDVFAESSFAKQIALAEIGVTPPIVKVGNLQSLRTVADVRDAVDAYYKLVTINPVPGEFYNIGGTATLMIGEILEKLIGLSTIRDIQVIDDPERKRPIDADLQIPNTNKFRRHTGWSPHYTLDQTLLDLLDYWRKRVVMEKDTWIVR